MSASIAIARVFWMLIGPVSLLLLAFAIIQSGAGWFTVPDLMFFIVLVGIIGARLFEFHSGSPLTTTGEPANLTDIQIYLIGVGTIGVFGWIIANLIGNHWLAR